MNEIKTPIHVKTENQIMELIQEFASSWSLVGGRYDDGSMLENANNLKQEIRSAYEALHKENEAQATRIAKLEEIINQKNILKTLVLFQTECEILADTFRNGNMASKAIGKIDLVKFMDKWDKLNSEVK